MTFWRIFNLGEIFYISFFKKSFISLCPGEEFQLRCRLFQASLIGTVVTKKEMTSLFHTKLKLDTFVAEAKVGKEKSVFRLNESGSALADEFGLSSSSDWFPLNDVAKFVKSVTRTTRASKYVDVWKESVAALSTKQVWIGGIFGEIDASVEVIIRTRRIFH